MADRSPELRSVFLALQLLAADYGDQVKAFPPFVHVPDELALTYDEAARRVDEYVRRGLLSSEQGSMLLKIDDVLEAMSGEADRWRVEALKDHHEWVEVRTLARHALSTFGLQLTKPRTFWTEL